jgi:hypothetical protein
MTVVIKSSTDSDETVKAALGDLAPPKPVDDPKPVEEKPVDPVEEPKEEPTEPVEDPVEPQEGEEPKEEPEEELEAKTDEEPKPPKKKGGFQKKIVKLEQEKEYWRQEALRAQANAKPAEPTKPIVDTSTRPKASDFATHDEYLESLVEWKADQKIAAINAKRQQDEAKNQVQTKFQTHNARVEAFKVTHEDFDETMENVNTIPMSLAVQESILDSDHGPEMMYALASDPKEFKRICSLPPLQAAREMGKLETKFIKTTSTSSETKTTRAPKPVTPVRTRGAAAVKDLNDPNISYEDYKRLRTEQIKQRSSMRR